MHIERTIADIIARYMYARMVANKRFDDLPAYVQDSYRADGVNLVRRLRETYTITERADDVQPTEEVEGKRFYELLAFREVLIADVVREARRLVSKSSDGSLRQLLVAADRLDAVDNRLSALTPKLRITRLPPTPTETGRPA